METSIPILVLKKEDQKLIIAGANPSFCMLVNFDALEILEKSVEEVASSSETVWMNRYASEALALIEINECWFEVETIRVQDEIAFIHHNLTTQVEMDSSNKRLQTRLNQIQRIALIGDWEHNFVTGHEFWSDEIYRMLDFEDKTIMPSVETFMCFVHPDDVKLVEDAHKRVDEGLGYRVEYRIVTITGKVKWIVTRAKVDLDPEGKVTRLYGTMQDITDRKNLQNRVVQAFDVAEDAYQSKSQFLALISHELRTPINGIMGMAQLLRGTPLDEEQSEFVEDILFSSDALISMIEDILEMSKIEEKSLKLDVEEFDLHIMVRNLVRMYQVKNRKKAVEFIHQMDVAIPKRVYGDASKIQQILINLIGNAFKFTNQGNVSFKVKLAEDGENKVKIIFEVEDTGVGIEDEVVSKIFNPAAEQYDSPITAYEGSGLGLAICRNYAELMKGYMLVESELGKGSKFSFAVTLERAASHDSGRDTDALRGRVKAVNGRILAIESEDVDRNYLNGYLKDICGFDIDFAEDLNSLIRALEHNAYEMMILGTTRRKEDVIYILKTVRESMKISEAQLPIVLMVTPAMRDQVTELEKAGVNYTVSKPVDESLLMDTINQILDLNTLRKKSKTRFAYRYIRDLELEKQKYLEGSEVFFSKIRHAIDQCEENIQRFMAAADPLNILMMSHAISFIDDLITAYGTEDICESLEMIEFALHNDDTAGIEVIIKDFMDEYQCFVKELQDFLQGKAAVIKKI